MSPCRFWHLEIHTLRRSDERALSHRVYRTFALALEAPECLPWATRSPLAKLVGHPKASWQRQRQSPLDRKHRTRRTCLANS